MIKWLIASAVSALVAVTPVQARENVRGEALTPERVFSAPDLNGPVAKGVSLSPDGRTLTFLKPSLDDANILDLWAAPTKGSGAARLLVSGKALAAGKSLSPEEIARRERQRTLDGGIVEYRWDAEGKALLIPLAGSLFVVDAASGEARELVGQAGGSGAATDARFSPKGNYVSFVRDGALLVTPSQKGAVRPVSPAAADAVTYAIAEFVAQEEFARDTGYWWRPDESVIAYTRVDESGVEVGHRLDVGATSSRIVEQRYPRAGTPNAKVDLFLQSLAGGPPVQVDLGDNPDVYLLRVKWSLDGTTLYAERQSRDQQQLDLLAIDPATGRSKVILTENQKPWINSNLDFTPLSDGGFLWVSERTGFRQLYLYDRDAKLVRTVTDGPVPLAGVDRTPSLLGVDEEKGLAYVLRQTAGATEQHVFSVNYRQGGALRQITQAPGWWTASMGQRGDTFVGTHSRFDQPPQTALFDANGKRLRWIVENPFDATHPYHPYRKQLPRPEFGRLAASDGQIMNYVLLKPMGFDPARRYPVIVQVYGGPYRQKVTTAWRSPEERLWLEAGYIVFQLDNRGTSSRGLAFEGAIAGKLGVPEVEDQLRGIAHLKQQPYVDPQRIGVTGWSYGGFMVLRLLTEPGAGIAAGAGGGGTSRWERYDTHYTERYLGQPQNAAAAYEASSVVPRLANLQGKYLLMHGMADDNVLIENATEIMARLQELGKPFDLMLYPGERHGITTPKLKLHQWLTYKAFFDRNIGVGK